MEKEYKKLLKKRNKEVNKLVKKFGDNKVKRKVIEALKEDI